MCVVSGDTEEALYAYKVLSQAKKELLSVSSVIPQPGWGIAMKELKTLVQTFHRDDLL